MKIITLKNILSTLLLSLLFALLPKITFASCDFVRGSIDAAVTSACEGTTINLEHTGENNFDNRQWQTSTTSGTSGFSNAGETGNTYSFTITQDTWVRVKMKVNDGDCEDDNDTKYTDVEKITMRVPNPLPVDAGSDKNVCSGGSVELEGESVGALLETITFGTTYSGNSKNGFTKGSYDYSYTRHLYRQVEIGDAGLITSMQVYVHNDPNNYTMSQQTIYLKNVGPIIAYTTPYNATNNGWSNPVDNGFTAVYSNPVTFNGSGWMTITFSTPFYYSGSGSLELIWENRDGSWEGGSPTFRYHSDFGYNCSVRDYKDSDFPDNNYLWNTFSNRYWTKFTKEYPNSYQWSGGPIVSGGNTLNPTVNPTSTTTYTLTATLNGCSASDEVEVTEDLEMTGNFNVCPGEATDLSVTGEAEWTSLPTGGTITTPPNGDIVHTFTSDGDFTTAQSIDNVSYLIVAGGGGGGAWRGGGGGAGGVVLTSQTVSANTYSVVIGAGGSGAIGGESTPQKGTDGANSSFLGTDAIGGGGGGGGVNGSTNSAGRPGGSGGGEGGSSVNEDGGSGTPGQGNPGGKANNGNSTDSRRAGGGGGASEAGGNGGSNAGNGGDGIRYLSISSSYFGGGGGGAVNSSGTNGAGGIGGGGAGSSTATGTDGTANTGGGGGGAGGGAYTTRKGGKGGSGIVIIRYAAPPKWTVTNGTGTATIDELTGFLTAGNIGTVTVNYTNSNGCSVDQVVTISKPSTALTSITPATADACYNNEVTLTASGGTAGSGSVVVWQEGACNNIVYEQNWKDQPFVSYKTTVNSVNGILNVTSENQEPQLKMKNIGSFDPNVYKYINIRYRVTNGTAGNAEIFWHNEAYTSANDLQYRQSPLNSDGNWHILSINMTTATGPGTWTDSDVTGWRYDWATNPNVTMELDFISLDEQPILAEGSIYTTPPLTQTTTYYASRRSDCGSSNCLSKTINLPTSGTTIGGNNDVATCLVTENDFIHFYHSSGRLIASINSHGQDLGNVTLTSYVGLQDFMKECNLPGHTLYYTAYMRRTWVMTSDAYPSGTDFNNNVSVRLPYKSSELSTLNSYAQTTTIGNPTDGGTTNPATRANLMLTKITGTTENGIVNLADCESTIRGVTSSGNGTNMLSTTNTEYVDFSIGQFSEFFTHKGNDNSALPVTLTNFSASCDKQVTLNWTTASEQNSDYFMVEKSRTGQEWIFVGEQEAAGNSTTTMNYNELDQNATNGVTYYRLRQVDMNGDEEMYGPISVSCSNNENSLTAFPNPNNGSFTIEVSSDEMHSDAHLLLTDMTGKVITFQNVDVSVGTTQVMMDNLNLPKGAYLVSLQGSGMHLRPIKVIVD